METHTVKSESWHFAHANLWVFQLSVSIQFSCVLYVCFERNILVASFKSFAK